MHATRPHPLLDSRHLVGTENNIISQKLETYNLAFRSSNERDRSGFRSDKTKKDRKTKWYKVKLRHNITFIGKKYTELP